MTNNYAIGFSYSKAGWEIVHGCKNSIVNWVINHQGKHVTATCYKDEAEMIHNLEGIKIHEAYEGATYQAIA